MAPSFRTSILIVSVLAAGLVGCADPSPMVRSESTQGMIKVASNDTASGATTIALLDVRPAKSLSGTDNSVAKATALWRAIRERATTEPVEWTNRATADHGAAVIVREVPIPGTDRVCREFRQSGVIDGHPYRSVGQACERQSGDWSLIQG